MNLKPMKNTVKDLAGKLGITVYRLGKDAKIPQSTIQKLSKHPDVMPSASVLDRLCHYHKLSITEIISPEPVTE